MGWTSLNSQPVGRAGAPPEQCCLILNESWVPFPALKSQIHENKDICSAKGNQTGWKDRPVVEQDGLPAAVGLIKDHLQNVRKTLKRTSMKMHHLG